MAQASSEADDRLFEQDRVGFELNLGAGALLAPMYQGSESLRVRPFPYINGGYGSWLDFDLLDGVRFGALNLHGFSMGPMVRLRDGRSTSDGRRHLMGLRRFSDTVEGGIFAAYTAGPLYADVSLTQDLLRSHGGAAMDARLLLSVPIGRVAFTAGPELRVATRQFMQSFYGVSETEAMRSGYGAHRTDGGLERIGGLLAAQWRITDRWSLQGFVEYGRLQNGAAASPLLKGAGGSRDQVEAGLFISYRLY